MKKHVLRRAIGEKKRAMTAAEIDRKSARLAEKLLDTEAYRRADSLFVYLSFNQEVRTEPIIRRAWADGKRVAVPKVVAGEMRFIWLNGFNAMETSAFGVPEPAADGPVADDDAALVVVPGLAFTPAGHRVGYGGGYYDRWLAAHPGHPTVALCYDYQLTDELEIEAHDVPLDTILTDA